MWQRQRLLFKLVSRGYATKSPSSSSSASSLTSAASSSKLPQSASSGLAAVWKKQAPNRDGPWSESQVQRQEAMTGPRFEQTDLSAQPSPLSAMELIAEQPVINVQGRIATCDGGGGPLGHPKVYINLDPDAPQECGYCGLRFQQEKHH